ncbi:MAG: molybdopterin-synthase adenylyltransferase MoeB [Bacteroidia bacterium]
MLSESEIKQYSRHLLLNEVGEQGQLNLKKASVIIVGAGGLGCPVLQYLVAAGVGKIGIVDNDVVDISNLQRQVLYSHQSIGKNKALESKKILKQLNPFIEINALDVCINAYNATSLLSDYDMVVDCTDNFSARYIINDACVLLNKPLVYGAIYKFEGQVSVFNYNNGPTYRCLYPELPTKATIPNCSEIGVLGVLPGIIGTLQANEVLKIILKLGNPLIGKLFVYDALNNSTHLITIEKQEHPIYQKIKQTQSLFQEDYTSESCSVKEEDEISLSELKELLTKEHVDLVDVRELWEEPKIKNYPVISAPLNELSTYINNIPKDKKVIVFCQKGIRSKAAIDKLKNEFKFTNLINLKDGIEHWK